MYASIFVRPCHTMSCWVEKKNICTANRLEPGLHPLAEKYARLCQQLIHGVVSQLDAQERGRIGRHGSGERRAKAREEGLQAAALVDTADRSEEHTSELQSRSDLVC